MVTVLLLLVVVVFIVAAALVGGVRARLTERARARFAEHISALLDEPSVPDTRHASGVVRSLRVELEAADGRTSVRAELPPAALGYAELIERFAGSELRAELLRHEITIDGAGRAEFFAPGRLSRARTLTAIDEGLRVLTEVRALRRFAAAELLARLPSLRSTREVDALLGILRRHFPEAPETRAATELAAQR